MVAARSRLLLLSALALLAGCGAPSGDDAPPTVPGEAPALRPTPKGSLEITVRDDRGTARASLRCSPGADRTTGYLRLERPPELCRRLGELKGTLVSPAPPGRACAEVYGGPAEAEITGRLDGRVVDRRLTRTDACQITDWDRLDVLLPEVG
jgi:hypothetical protein